MSGAIHSVFRKIAPGFAIDDLRTMQQTVDASNFNERLGFYLIGSFAGLAVVMVIVGLYGVLSQLVNRRRQEIGVRMALGATSESILALILRQGSFLIAVGLGAGILAALGTSQLISSFLYGVRPMDVWSYLATAILLLVIGLLAAAVPAKRAANIEPMEALRTE
jgi:ABC-type antimicrobial peptide transport system permease subunit